MPRSWCQIHESFKVEFGGLPRNYMLNGQKHFIRFTVLPDDVTPGHINLLGMRRTNLPPPNIAKQNVPQMDINKIVEKDMVSQPPPIIPQAQPPSDQGTMNINELLQKLVAIGIIGNTPTPAPAPVVPTPVVSIVPVILQVTKKEIAMRVEDLPRIITVNLAPPETIKMRQQAIVDSLYIGIQCGSCGLRFPPEQTIRY